MMLKEKNQTLRHELKYEINQLEYQVLQKKLCTFLKPDPHMISNGHCHYNVRSIYFDDFYNAALNDKEAGVQKRKKYRIRIYNHSDDFIKFERKSKTGAYTLKESTRISRDEANQLIAKDFSFLAQTENLLLRDFYLENRCNLMRPAVIVEYEREAYVHPVGNVRITFDTELQTSCAFEKFFDKQSRGRITLDQQGIILEAKYTEVLPEYIRGLFPDTIRMQSAIGKYVICRKQQLCQMGL